MVTHSIAAVFFCMKNHKWDLQGNAEFTGRVNGFDEKVDSPRVAAAKTAGDSCV